MRYWKCVESKREDWFTVGKIYKSEDGKVKDNDRDLRDAEAILNCDLYKFTEVKEQDYINQEKGEDKMKDLRELLKVGCIVKVLYREVESLCHVMINSYDELILSGEKYWAKLNKDSIPKIIEIYDRVSYNNREALKLNTRDRKLIWKRTEKSPTQIKLEELEKKQRELADEMEKLRKEV